MPEDDEETEGRSLTDTTTVTVGSPVLEFLGLSDPVTVSEEEVEVPRAEPITAAESLRADDPAGRPVFADDANPQVLPLGIQGIPQLAPIPTDTPTRGGTGDDLRVSVQELFSAPPTPEETAALHRLGQIQQAELLNRGAAELQMAEATATELEDYADLVEEAPMSAQRAFDSMVQQRDRMLAEIDDTLRTVSSTRIDPSRFFHSRGAATSFGAALSIAAGAVASTLAGGPNMAAQIIDRAIERDIRAQEFDIQNQRSGAALRFGLLDRLRNTFRDDQAALESIRSMRYANAQARLRAMSARATSDVQRAGLENLINSLEDRRLASQAQVRASTTRFLLQGNIRNERQAHRARELARIGQREATARTAREVAGALDIPEETPGTISRSAVRGRPPRTPSTSASGEVEIDAGNNTRTSVPRFSAAAEDGIQHSGNVLIIAGGERGDQFFHLLPDSPLRIQAGDSGSTRLARERERGAFSSAFEGALQANNAMRRAAQEIRRAGFPDTLEQFNDADNTRLRTIYDQAVRRWVEMRRAATNSGTLGTEENQRFSEEAGRPSTFEQILERITPGDNVGETFAVRMEEGATDAADVIARAAQQYRVIVPRSQLARLRTSVVGGSR